ncbi:hypothetical protein [Caballeronia sordidicola]|uniref:hypothetical protein n=1 Tax=Caballeronia sordidicola TaxID=196367 RepID=UPI0004D0293D|nr:hypothetical protein [Caballeronia sordidicola]
MPEQKKTESSKPLPPLAAAVAEKAKVPLATVESIFAQANVVEQAGTRHSESLTIRRVLFSGEKSAADSGDGPFTFEWSDLEAGLWLVLSDNGNQIGKSTILEVMLWALRGTTRGLRPEVRAWIHHVELVFSIGLDWYCVQFDDYENTPVGAVLRTAPGPAQVLANFAGNEQFEQVMERLMMGRFALQPIPFVNHQGDVAEQAHHTWSLYARSMFIEGSHPAILGDVAVGAAWWRMLQLFIGMPYTGAQMALKSASILEVVRSEQVRASIPAPVSRQPEIQRLNGRIEQLNAGLTTLSASTPRPEDAPELLRSYTREAMEYARLRQAVSETEHQLAAAITQVSEARAEVRRLEDGSAAKHFFAGLSPVCCPRCAQPFPSERLESEQAGGGCAVCDRDAPGDDHDALEDAIAEAKERLNAARAAEDELRTRDAHLRSDLAVAKKQTDALEARIQRIDQNADNILKQQELRWELERARGACEQLVALEQEALPSTVDEAKAEQRRVLKEGERIAEERAKSAGAQMLAELEEELVEVAARVGFKGLEKVAIRGNGITLTVSGTPSGFSLQTSGQRLRLRIALVVAMMRLASINGQGHHPGLLFIDSPGAEEVSEDDLNAMMTEIRTVCDETRNLQIFVASARGATLTSAVSKERQIWPKPSGSMF